MRPRDLDAVLAIERVSFPSAWSADSYLRELRNPCSHYFVARLGDKIIGYAGMWTVSGEAHVSTLAVAPSYRRLGLGEHLMQHLISVAVEHNSALMTLEVRQSNLQAQILYHKLGFQVRGLLRRYYGDTDEDGIIMCKVLNGEHDPQSEPPLS
jgi:ribosomal-protein-alanine N-acetyltransferase